MTIFTADVSSNDGPVDWAAAGQAGISAAFVKASEGGGPRYRYTNPLFVGQHDGALDAGLAVVGAYHCLSGDDVDKQISYFLQALGEGKSSLTTPQPAMLDVEPFDELRRAGALPDFAHVEAFADRWWSREQGPLALYLPHWVWDNWGRPSLTGLAGQISLISSNYPDRTPRQMASMYAAAGGDAGPGWAPYGGLDPVLWQFGSTCVIPGIRSGSDGADINAFRGTRAELVELFTGAQLVSTPPTHQHEEDFAMTNWTTLTRGSSGEAVRVAQGLLIARGLPVGSRDGRPDGSFGPATEQSTKDLQARYGIGVDGQFGPHTLSVGLYGRDLAA